MASGAVSTLSLCGAVPRTGEVEGAAHSVFFLVFGALIPGVGSAPSHPKGPARRGLKVLSSTFGRTPGLWFCLNHFLLKHVLMFMPR